MPDKKWGFWNNGMPGLHLTINPQSPLSPEARIYRHFIQRGLTLGDEQLKSLVAGRSEGIASMDAMLGHLVPGLGADTRLKLSTKIADALLNKSLEGQLAKEAPTLLEQSQQRDEVLKHLFRQAVPPGQSRGSVPRLLERLPPVGVSLTIHF